MANQRLNFETVSRAINDVGGLLRQRESRKITFVSPYLRGQSCQWSSRENLQDCLDWAESIREKFQLPTNLIAYRLKKERYGKQQCQQSAAAIVRGDG
jgi:hypothetical protein